MWAVSKRPARKHLGADELLAECRRQFEAIADHRAADREISLPDALLAGVALFQLKDPSLLAFGKRAPDANFRAVFGIKRIASDTQMREILDGVDPEALRPTYRALFRQLQRGKVLESMRYLDEGLLVSLDGVEYFSSSKVHCDKCLQRKRRAAEGPEYYHQMLAAVVVHPDKRQVIPLMPEPICRQDGTTKNDCERNAAIRFLQQFRRDHPHLAVIVLEDGLGSNGPHIRELLRANCHFILGAKDGDHASLQQQLDHACQNGAARSIVRIDQKGVRRTYVWANRLRLNDSHSDLRVNYLRYLEEEPDGTIREFTWVTDLTLTQHNVGRIARAGRSRWKVENETFNTLKNQGYHFEHNFGHGHLNLSVVFALLMMLAFLIDQIQELTCRVFQQALAAQGSRRGLWQTLRSLWQSYHVTSLLDLYAAVAHGFVKQPLQLKVQPGNASNASSAASTPKCLDTS